MDISTDFRRKMIIRLIEVLKESPSFCNISLAQLKEAVLNSEHQTFQQSKSKDEYIYYINEKLKKIKQSSPKSVFLQNNMPNTDQRHENNQKIINGNIPPYVKVQQTYGQSFAPQNKFQAFTNQFDNGKRSMDLNSNPSYQDKPAAFSYQASNQTANKYYSSSKEFQSKNTQRPAENVYFEPQHIFSGSENNYKYKPEAPAAAKEPAKFSNQNYNSAQSIAPIKARINSEIFQSSPRQKGCNQDMMRNSVARSPNMPLSGVPEKKLPCSNFYIAPQESGDLRSVDPSAKKHSMVNDTQYGSNFVRADTSRIQNKPVQKFDKKHNSNFREQNSEQLSDFLNRTDASPKRNDEFYRSKYDSIKFPSEFNGFDGHNGKSQKMSIGDIHSDKFVPVNPGVRAKESLGFRNVEYQECFASRQPEMPQKSINRSPSMDSEKYCFYVEDLQGQRGSPEDSDLAALRDYSGRNLPFGNKTVKQPVKAVASSRNIQFESETKLEMSGPKAGLQDLMFSKNFKLNEDQPTLKNFKNLIVDDAISYDKNAAEAKSMFKQYSEDEIKPSKDKGIVELSVESATKASNLSCKEGKAAIKHTNIDYFFESNTKLPFEPLRDNFDLEINSHPRVPESLKVFLDKNGLACKDVDCLKSWKTLFEQVFFMASNSEAQGEELSRMTYFVIKQKEFIEYPFLDLKMLQQFLEKLSEPKSKIEYEVLIEKAIQAYAKKKTMDKDFSLENNE